jgi:hypothetical protein
MRYASTEGRRRSLITQRKEEHASGSAMALVWAHSEYVKLRRSLHDDRVFDTPPGRSALHQDSHRFISCHLAIKSQVSRNAGRQNIAGMHEIQAWGCMQSHRYDCHQLSPHGKGEKDLL